MCEHKFVYGGVKYQVQEWMLPGSGAQPVYYFDWFYCEKCLERHYKRLPVESNTYQKTLFNASPVEQSEEIL